jgi:hypothetical protein
LEYWGEVGTCLPSHDFAFRLHDDKRRPDNVASSSEVPRRPRYLPDPTDEGSFVVALLISGGGTRAAAFEAA